MGKSDVVAIILINYNSWKDTIECLESVFKLNGGNYQVFLVDNSNDDSNVNHIISWAKGELGVEQTDFPDLVYPNIPKPVNYSFFKEDDFLVTQSLDLHIVKANQNNGFAAGNNIILRQLLGKELFKHIWLLNNDTVVKKNALNALVETSRSKSLDIVGSTMLYYSKPEVLQGIGGSVNKWFGYANPIKNGVIVHQITGNEIIDYPIGASMLITQEFLYKVGLLSEEYFLYYEEIDWVLRGKKFNFNTGYSKKSWVYHKVGASIGSGKAEKRSEFADYYSLKNRIFFVKKYYPYFLPIAYLGFSVVILNRIRRRKFNSAKNAFKILLGMPVTKFNR